MKRLLSALCSVLLLLLLVLPGVAHADVNDFVITDFKADYYLSQEDRQGALDIDERLDVVFSDFNHGILRAIPQRYNGNPLHVRVQHVMLDGITEQYSTYTSNGNLVLKIGNPNKTMTGSHHYAISYHVENVMRFDESGWDELDWNVNGTQWQQPFEHIEATLHIPSDIADKVSKTACYTGGYGGTAADCTVAGSGDTRTFTTTRRLYAGENLTLRADVPKGVFASPTLKDRWDDYGSLVLQVVVVPIIVFGLAYSYWRKNGKDLKGRGTIIPEYTPPEKLSPIEADTIMNYKLGTKAISATIIDLAIRKYLRIIETESKKLLGLGKNKAYSLELLNKDFSKLNPYETQIMAAIFSGETVLVDISSLKNKFYRTSSALQKQLPADLTKAGYFTSNPQRVGSKLLAVGIVLAVVAFMFHSFVSIGIGIAAAICLGFAALMPKRSPLGVATKDTLEGLKLYMNTVEKDRIAMMQSPDSPYAKVTTPAPQQTVELFEKLLPFAMILGVEEKWAKQFEHIYNTPPDWYSGNWSTFNTGYLVGSLNSSVSAINTSFASPSSSGSGSGGGFSGGGGGGGGGGGW